MLAQSFFFGDIEWEKSFTIILYEFFVLIDNFYVTLMSSQCGSVYQAAYGSAWASYGLLQFPTRRASQKFLTSNFITKISHVHFFYGPYSVISQEHNDIICTHCHLQTQHIFHSDRVSPFLGTLIDATKLGLLDKEEYVVSAVLRHRGNLNRL